MNKFKFTVLAVMVLFFASLNSPVNASGVGFINYKKIQDSYPYAVNAAKEVDSKALELQQYLVDKEKEFKALDTPVKKKNFEEKTQREFKDKQDAYLKLKAAKEDDIYGKIQDAAKQILIEQKLDTIIDFRVIFVGGMDVSDLVIQKLNKK